MKQQHAEVSSQPSKSCVSIRATRGRFWASTVALMSMLIIAIDTEVSGLQSLPLSVAEFAGGCIFGMISALTIRIVALDDARADPASKYNEAA